MILYLQMIIATVIICPLIAFVMIFVSGRRMKIDQHRAIGVAADVTTAVLFFSVPIAIQALWSQTIFIPIYVVALLIALTFTYMDWIKKKEIQVIPLLKKIWRAYFLLLGTIYFFIWIAGLVHSVVMYMAGV